LATIQPDGRPHLVPITFAMRGDVLFCLVDQKPKSTRDLKRLRNIERDPRVTVLVDRYDDDWTRLWWCRGEGSATVVLAHEAGFGVARDAVTEKYQQYLEEPPEGPAIRIEIAEWSGWAAAPGE
jgi:PPOX class probable F420-dependent enzyme